MAILKILTADEYEKIFKPYAVELGRLVSGWNRLHEKLGALFCSVTGIDNASIPLAIWYSTQSDRAQREMLRAANAARSWNSPLNGQMIRADIEWLIVRTDALSTQRNDAIHSPFLMSTGADGTKVEAHTFQGNPRAKKLKNKDLLKEFRWYTDCSEVLGSFAEQMHHHIAFPTIQESWPTRPDLPKLGEKQPKSISVKARKRT